LSLEQAALQIGSGALIGYVIGLGLKKTFLFLSATLFMSVEENMNLMKTLDDAWNSQDWKTFSESYT